jgi:transglutaminase-like putative cysteine protease
VTRLIDGGCPAVEEARKMQLRVGYELVFNCPQPVPMMLSVSVHSSRRCDLVTPDTVLTDPSVPVSNYQDRFGNICSRIVAPAGQIKLSSEAIVRDSGQPDCVAPHAQQVAVEDLPDDTLVFLLGSRYCETDRLSPIAWSLFGNTPPGWARVQAICDFVHNHLTFGYPHARPTRTAWEAHAEKVGVCRDYTHLAVAFARCMNIPARYCTGYVSDIGQPPPYAPMDFAAWLEVYLDGGWYTFDPRNHAPRIGRILMARGRDASDVAISNSFGPSGLCSFRVVTEEVKVPEPALQMEQMRAA